MFRGKESSNRIELSRLVQKLIEFWCFGLPAALGVGGWVYGGGGCLGGAPHTHAHAHTCTHAHTRMVNMIISCKWLPPLGKSLGIPYDVIRVCVHMRVHMCEGHPVTTPHPHPPTPHPPGGAPQESIKIQ